MEENKIDIYQIIGFLFLIAAFFWWFNVTIPELEQDALEENETISQIQNQDENKNPVKDITEIVSFKASNDNAVIGSELDSEEIIIENDCIYFHNQYFLNS